MLPIPILITGVGGGGHGHELVKTLKLESSYRIIGVDMSPTSLGLFDVDEAYTVPPATDGNYLDVLLDICKHKDIKVIIPGSEPELKVISEQRDRFLESEVLPLINTAKVIEIATDKFKTMKFLSDHGFKMPVSLLVNSIDEIPDEFPLPAVIKPAVGGGGSNNTFVVQDVDELRFACYYLVRQGRIVLLQEYVGDPYHEYTVGVLNALDGCFVGSIALKRNILSGLSNRIKIPNRTERKELSPILAISSGVSQGDIEDYSEIREECERIANAIESKGPLNVQCRFVNGHVIPFEINPRFSGTSYMRALAGFNEPDILIRYHLLGEPLPQKIEYKHGRMVRGLVERYVQLPSPVKPWISS